jgi:putative endonuclease
VKRYFVYMLRCFDGTFYVGMTKNVETRFGQHCDGVDPNCYTFSRRPLRLIHVSEFGEVIEAISFEKRLKSWSHRKKRAFADASWDDLKRYTRGQDRKS